jgi:hypothetical protein
MKKLIIGAALMMLAAPALAQAYNASDGSGNIVNLPLAERTNGAAGVGMSAYDGAGMSGPPSAYAYAPQRHYARHDMRRVRQN